MRRIEVATDRLLALLPPLQRHQIADDQCFLLRARPAFELSFPRQGSLAIRKLFGVRDPHRPTRRRVHGGAALVVFLEPLKKVASLADIERPVGTTQNVDEPHATTMPSSVENVKCDTVVGEVRCHGLRPFDSSRDAFGIPLVAQGIRPVRWLAMSETSSRPWRDEVESNGAPSMIRTCDLLVRSQTLYPAELWARQTFDLNTDKRGHRPAMRAVAPVCDLAVPPPTEAIRMVPASRVTLRPASVAAGQP